MFVNHYDWKIHRILDKDRTIYICPARGCGHTYTQLELYAELMTQNKNVKVIRVEDVEKAIDRFKSVPDFDLEFVLERQAKYGMFVDYSFKPMFDYRYDYF